jgi:transcription-repair coupling factor (superfamily II helicase)
MQLIGLTDLLRESTVYREVLARLDKTESQTLNVIRAARPFLLAALAADWNGAILYLTARGKRTYNVAEQLPVWLNDETRIYRFAEPTPMFYDRLPWDSTVIRERLQTLNALLSAEATGAKPIVIAPARALMQRTMPVNQFRKRTQTLTVGQRYQIDALIHEWVALGYEHATMVTEPGTFSRRGGIVDIFPLASDLPIRIEFFDDEFDTFRKFNPATQRTVETVKQVTVIPAREALPEWMPNAAKHLQGWFDAATVGDDVGSLQQDYESMQNAQAFTYLEHYLPYVIDNPVSILDYAPANTLLVVEDMDELRQTVEELAADAEANRETNRQSNQLPQDYPLPYINWDLLSADLEKATRLELGVIGIRDDAPDSVIAPRLFRPGERFGGQLRPTLTHVRERHNAGEHVVVVTQQVPRLETLWYEQDAAEYLPKAESILDKPESETLAFITGELSEGWTLDTGTTVVNLITDSEIFGWSRPEPRRRKASKRGASRLPESDYSDWHDGDYVVHIDYGIGRFRGMGKRTMDGTEREYLVVEYAQNGELFVPIHQADRLTRYVGADDHPPKLNTMGKQDVWTRTKDKARKNALEEARELLSIYAQRAGAAGHHFSSDTAWQHELEASFPYVETEDQLHVIQDIKQDMESSMPMDRLVCGDVGYGKTEVALRAAFKAVMDGKQVAVLVPTTVLAQQHYETFRRRMEPFPVKVELLSRFRTKAEQSKILTDITNGKVDIIIGTHRILSEDISLQNLGLIIIDEEQRFGVKHKEHFKKLRANVDILTLTATPIPRTLYMSLSGVRDISMIQTPPEDRVPVITHVGAFDPKLTRQAILRELDRGGQVFVIHNRVKTIEAIKDKLESIVPEASVVVAHGQMSGRQLEQKIAAFSKGEYDILLATSIIENGIDMPNVNTLIVDRADLFGMAQLYQIRGRVGRSATQAYAYFFHGGGKKLSEEARARLETLAEYTDLGSGFQISVRDLELRGAGDILSMKQTGHVALVGLQLYTQLLQQAVAELKGESDSQTLPTYAQEKIIIDLPLPAYIPSDWISEMALRLQLYRRIGSLQTLEDVEKMEQELRDRFGVLPNAVEGLLYQIQVKLLATGINATAVIKPREHVLIKVPWLMAVDRAALALQLGDDVEVSRTAVEILFDKDVWQLRLLDVLKELKAGVPEQVGV